MNQYSQTILSPERTLEIVLNSIGELVDYELAVVLACQGDDLLVVRKAMGPLVTPRLEAYSVSLTLRPDLVALLDSGRPRLFSETEEHRDTYEEIIDLPEGHSCLAAPLVAEGVTIGLLTLDNRRCGAFSAEILRFIGAISSLVAVALLQAESSRILHEKAALLVEERNRLLDLDSDAFRCLVGGSPAWIRALDSIRLVASTEAPVLLLGETGTGKEEAARAIHRLSPRSGGPFIAVNCSALPPSLAESELFGHEKGSFTGAQTLRRGRFELAHGGTLFLDEVGDLPLELQPKLLRVIQEGSIERIGGEKAVKVDTRILAATHVDLWRAVEEGRFRGDLYYRLAVFPIRLPPLRERKEDIIILAELFAGKLRKRPGWEKLRYSADSLETLRRRTWSGNVRELRNAVERAAILARGGEIGPAELAVDDDLYDARPAQPLPGNGELPASSLEEVLRAHIAGALKASGGRIYGEAGAARLLGLKPSTLQSKMKKLGLKRS